MVKGDEMKYEITHDQLFEIVLCIVQCDLSEEEACDYALAVIEEMNDIKEVVL